MRISLGCSEGGVSGESVAELAVRRFTEGKEVGKVVYVPNQLLNLVVG
jgi:hypothetical protein